MHKIPNLEQVPVGIANFDNIIRESVEEGGTQLTETEKKNDLMAILPHGLQSNLIWSASDVDVNCVNFRDRIKNQAAKMQLMKRKQVNLLGGEEESSANKASDDDDETTVAALGKFGKKNASRKPAPNANRSPTAGNPTTTRCINCGGNHRSGDCPKGPVEKSQRPCWKCGKTGHIGRDCPNKRPIKSVTDDDGQAAFMLDYADTTVKPKQNFPKPELNMVVQFLW